MSDQDIPVPPMPIEHQAARQDQIWERVKQETEKFIADAAVLIMGGQNTALVADQFAGMAMRSHPAHVATMMATLLVQVATERLREKGLLPEMPPDPFDTPDGADISTRDLVESFVNELTALAIRHGMAIQGARQAIYSVHTQGPQTGQLATPALAQNLAWAPQLARYACQAPGDQPEWTVP